MSPKREAPNKVFGWWAGDNMVFGILPPDGEQVVEYTFNNEGVAHISVELLDMRK